MNRGLVLGKFMPLHTGHISLIRFAKEQCDELIVWVCKSDTESMLGDLRLNWLREQFANDSHIKIVLFEYTEDDLPNTSASSESVSRVWAEKIRSVLPRIDTIFSTEDYGDYVAKYLNIEHIRFQGKKRISASDIRRDPYQNWRFVPTVVKPYYFKKICVVGTESTGKSTLVQQISSHYQVTCVVEAGRELIRDSRSCTFEDLRLVAREHAKRIQIAAEKLDRFIVVDTDVRITKSYAKFLFDSELVVDDWIESENRFDLILFLENDVPFVQDGTRLSVEDRDALHMQHVKEFRDAGLQVEFIGGSYERRLSQAIATVDRLLNSV